MIGCDYRGGLTVTYWDMLMSLAPAWLAVVIYRVWVPLAFVVATAVLALLPFALWRWIVPQGKE